MPQHEQESRRAGAVRGNRHSGAPGDLLVTIDPAPFAAEVARLRAQVAAAEARVSFTKGEFERGRRLRSELHG